MTGEEFKAIRLRLGLSRAQFGYVLGYTGKAKNGNSLIWRMEREAQKVMPWIANLASMYDSHGVPEHWLPPKSWWKESENV